MLQAGSLGWLHYTSINISPFRVCLLHLVLISILNRVWFLLKYEVPSAHTWAFQWRKIRKYWNVMETTNLSISPSWTNFIWLGEAFSISINYRQFVWGYAIEKKDLLTLRASSFHIWNDSKIETKGNHSMETFCFHKIHSLTCICRTQFSQGNKSALLFEKTVSLELKRRTERKRWRESEREREG